MTRVARLGLMSLAVTVALAAAAPAGAGTLTSGALGYFYTADNGETDSMAVNPGAVGRFVLSVAGDTIVLSTGTSSCTLVFANQVNCPLATDFTADLRDGNDSISVDDTVPMEFWLEGDEGNDSLDGGMLADTVLAGAGNDILSGGPGDDIIQPHLGVDTNIQGGEGTDTLSYLDGRLTPVTVNVALGTAAPDGDTFTGIERALGTNADDILVATDAGFRVELVGFGGHDILAGGTQEDLLNGGSGNDTMGGNEGNDTLRGDDGADIVGGGSGADTLRGEAGADRLSGNGGADLLVGGADADALYGTAETGASDSDLDIASYSDRSTPVVSTLMIGGVRQDSDTYADISGLEGGFGNDVLTGDATANELRGGLGDDVLIGGGGGDVLDGTSGIDLASYEERGAEVSASLLTGVNGDGDAFSAIDGLRGGNGADRLEGNSLANVLEGGGGNDVLVGGAGADTLAGGPGAGDVASYEGGPGVDANLATGENFHNDVYSSIEGLRGGGGVDFLWGDEGPNMLDGGDGQDTLIGGLGADTLIGGAGLNTASYQDGRPPAMGLPTGIYLNLNALPGPDGDTYSGISRFIGTDFDDDMQAGTESVEFLAADGDDLVRVTGSAPDRVNCGAGNDAVEASVSGDVIEDCEVVQIGEAAVGVGDVSVVEGNSGATVVAFTVALDQAVAYPATFEYETRDGTAVAPSDYVSASGQVTFATGDRTATVNVTINGDELIETDETFTLALLPFFGSDVLDEGTATIANDDAAPAPAGLPTLTISNAKVKEGNRGTKAMKFLVRLSAAATQPVTVRFKTQKGTAKPRQDFVGRSFLLTFQPGQTLIQALVKIKGDRRDERNEKFKALLSNAVGATLLDAEGVGTIRDNDP